MPFPTLLSLAPYPFLPATSGGQLAQAQLHRSLACWCTNIVAGTQNNQFAGEPFHFVPLFAPGPGRYVPFRYAAALVKLGREKGVGAVLCEHPYMALTAHRVARRLGVPWFLRSHNIESERFRGLGKKWWPLLARYEKWAMQRAQATFFMTTEDASWAIANWNIAPEKCVLAPFGTPLKSLPAGGEKEKEALAQTLSLNAGVPWFYFLGALDYAPNTEALQCIIEEVVPRLRSAGRPFELLLAGRGLSAAREAQTRDAGICITGFLPSLDNFLRATDVMLNPVLSGGGIKTKAVEALAWGKGVVSCQAGAAGLVTDVCGNALRISANRDWDTFVADALALAGTAATVPPAFYAFYNVDAVAQKMLEVIFRGAVY